jgi:hypothetical protein
VAVEGWCSVEDLVRWAFAHAPVVMANEAHNGLARCVRTREVGVRMIQAAHEAGVRRLAMEALPHRRGEPQGPILAIPPESEGYLTQPDMQRLIGAALALGWTLWAYGEWIPMWWHFRDMSGIDPFVIDQDVTVDFGREPQPWVRDLLASVSDILAAHGGTAGILRDQAPSLLAGWAGVDALVVSTDNEMTA